VDFFTRRLPADLWIIAPRGPHAAKEGGYSWRALPSAQASDWGLPTLSDLRPAAEGLVRLVDEVSASIGVDATQFDVAGFSQGGALTDVLSLLYPQRIRKRRCWQVSCLAAWMTCLSGAYWPETIFCCAWHTG